MILITVVLPSPSTDLERGVVFATELLLCVEFFGNTVTILSQSFNFMWSVCVSVLIGVTLPFLFVRGGFDNVKYQTYFSGLHVEEGTPFLLLTLHTGSKSKTPPSSRDGLSNQRQRGLNLVIVPWPYETYGLLFYVESLNTVVVSLTS